MSITLVAFPPQFVNRTTDPMQFPEAMIPANDELVMVFRSLKLPNVRFLVAVIEKPVTLPSIRFDITEVRLPDPLVYRPTPLPVMVLDATRRLVAETSPNAVPPAPNARKLFPVMAVPDMPPETKPPV